MNNNATQAVQHLLRSVGADLEADENFQDTPRRFAEYFAAHFKTSEQLLVVEASLGITFPSQYKGMITQTHIKVYGMCPHHLLPIEYDISIAYIPEGRVLGLSKLSRLAQLYGSLAKLQEDVTQDIADALERLLSIPPMPDFEVIQAVVERDEVQSTSLVEVTTPLGIAVTVAGVHSCMSIRGTKQEDAKTVTSVMKGVFLDPNKEARQEFLQLIKEK